jgi:hypothetical protein
MVQDRKKLRPGVVGGRPGRYAFSSEICGLDAAIPDRDKSKDFQPMHLDTVHRRTGAPGGFHMQPNAPIAPSTLSVKDLPWQIALA